MVNRNQIGAILLIIGLLITSIGVLGVAQAGPFAPKDCAAWTIQVNERYDIPEDEEAVPFENLSTYQQQKFRDALEDEFNSHEVPINQSKWSEASESPQWVKYEESNYRLFVKQNECNVFQEIYVMGGALVSVIGIGLGVVGFVLRKRSGRIE